MTQTNEEKAREFGLKAGLPMLAQAKSLLDTPTVVCLCGSTRFGDLYSRAMRDETLKGHIVLTVGLLGHQEGIDMSGPLKAALDALHLHKVALADEVLVLNGLRPWCPACERHLVQVHYALTPCCRVAHVPRPYVGDSTRREIAHALALGKPVRYLIPPEAASPSRPQVGPAGAA